MGDRLRDRLARQAELLLYAASLLVGIVGSATWPMGWARPLPAVAAPTPVPAPAASVAAEAIAP